MPKLNHIAALMVSGQAAMIAVSVGLTWLFTRRFQHELKMTRLQQRTPPVEMLRYEMRYTLVTVLVGSALAVAMAYLFWCGILIFETGAVSPLEIALQCAGYLLAMDAYQYAVHRLMHTRYMFKHVHSVHHRSKTTNPLSSFSFHPAESTINGLFVPLILLCGYFHLYSMLIVGVVQFFLNTIPHCGFELYPRWWQRTRFSRWLITPLYHDLHHDQHPMYNYGTITVIWDRIFGTIQPGFHERLERLRAGEPEQESR